MKKKVVIIISAIIGLVLIMIVFFLNKENNEASKRMQKITLEEIKSSFPADIQALKDGKYTNLTSVDFETTIINVEGIYNLEIQSDNSYQDRAFLENFETMNETIDQFFQEEIDKTFIQAEFEIEDEIVWIDYNDIKDKCTDNTSDLVYLFGNDTSNGGYMVQTSESLINTWFSRNGLGSIGPFMGNENGKVFTYLSGVRQEEDVVVSLQDKDVKLSEMEEQVLTYLNEDFLLPFDDSLEFEIATIRYIDNDEYKGLIFGVRRKYGGVPFEYGSSISSGIYTDEVQHDSAELAYAVSEYPDTLVGFGRVNGKVVEIEEITEFISVGDALGILSAKIGENSVYKVFGVELVYRNSVIPEEKMLELDDILIPKWKIITLNQNDDKYTLFYVDVVTGEVTERFEYYYE